MFHHNKELQFDARVSGPDPAFARLLLEQFGGGNGELKAAMQYFTQAFLARQAFPDKYDLLMDIATEEFSHLEIVGATITMLLEGVNGELKNAVERTTLAPVMRGAAAREELLHQAATSPQFLCLTGGGPTVSDSAGVPWSGAYVNANGDLTVDFRSDIAAESRAKIVYEYLAQFTPDPHVQRTLEFLMTREISHMQMFSAALDSIQPNFPPGVLQGSPRYSHLYFDLSDTESARGAWNQGQGPWADGQEWVYISDPQQHVERTRGLSDAPAAGGSAGEQSARRADTELSRRRSEEIRQHVPLGENRWSAYPPPFRKAS